MTAQATSEECRRKLKQMHFVWFLDHELLGVPAAIKMKWNNRSLTFIIGFFLGMLIARDRRYASNSHISEHGIPLVVQQTRPAVKNSARIFLQN